MKRSNLLRIIMGILLVFGMTAGIVAIMNRLEVKKTVLQEEQHQEEEEQKKEESKVSKQDDWSFEDEELVEENDETGKGQIYPEIVIWPNSERTDQTLKVEDIFNLENKENVNEVEEVMLTFDLSEIASQTDINETENKEEMTQQETTDFSEDTEEIEQPETTEEPEKIENPVVPLPPVKPVEQHVWGAWTFKDDTQDERECSHCGIKETGPHVLVTKQTDVTPNQGGTHMVETTNVCSNCKNTFVKEEEEACDYEISSYQRTGINDTHIEVKDCKICNAHAEEEGTCVPVGELKVVKIYAQIYEYYDCELCGDMCERQYHTNHQYGPWEHRDDKEHIRYCICVEARETRPHDYEYDGNGTLTCDGCKDVKTVIAHDHGYGTYRNMGLMEIIKSPAYGELVDTSQISNPNPNPNDYCSRYDFCCKTCGVYYYVYYDHDFQNGFCTRKGYCGEIAQPTAIHEEVACQTDSKEMMMVNEEETEGTQANDESTESTDANGESTEGTDVNDESTEGTDANGESTEGTDANDESTESTDANGESTEGTEVNGESTEGTDVNGESAEGTDANDESTEDGDAESEKIEEEAFYDETIKEEQEDSEIKADEEQT